MHSSDRHRSALPQGPGHRKVKETTVNRCSTPNYPRTALTALALSGVMAAPASAQETRGRAMSGDLEIYYEVHGDLASGVVPFLVLHGGMGSIASDFGGLLPALAAQRPVIRVEQQGHGRTGGRNTSVSLAFHSAT